MINYRSESFDPAYTAHLNLVLTLEEQSLFYGLYNPTEHNIEMAGYQQMIGGTNSHEVDLVKFLTDNSVLQGKFNNVKAAVSSKHSFIAPIQKNRNFSIHDLTKWFSSIEEEFKLYPVNDQFGVYAVPQNELLNAVHSIYPLAEIVSTSSAFLKGIEIKPSSELKIYCYVTTNQLMIAVDENGELKFFNTFQYSSVNDFIYYLMLVTNQLNIDQTKSTLVLSGELDRKSELMNQIEKFYSHVNFNSPSLPSPALGEPIPEHFFSTTIALTL